MKILVSNSPSYIKGESGSWFSMHPGNARMEVEANITERNGQGCVNLNLHFNKELPINLVASIIGASIIILFLSWLGITNFPGTSEFSSAIPWLAIALSVLYFCLVITRVLSMHLINYNVSLTRRKFMKEINMFIQSSAEKW